VGKIGVVWVTGVELKSTRFAWVEAGASEWSRAIFLGEVKTGYPSDWVLSIRIDELSNGVTMHRSTPLATKRSGYHASIHSPATPLANPNLNILSTSSPLASRFNPCRQSHPLFTSSTDFTNALLPVPLLVCESNIELPTNEKLLPEVMLLIVFSNCRGDGGVVWLW